MLIFGRLEVGNVNGASYFIKIANRSCKTFQSYYYCPRSHCSLKSLSGAKEPCEQISDRLLFNND